MDKATFKVTPVVQITIQARHADRHDRAVYIRKFVEWAIEGGVVDPRTVCIAQDGDTFIGLFYPKDAAQIQAWLLKNGGEQEKE